MASRSSLNHQHRQLSRSSDIRYVMISLLKLVLITILPRFGGGLRKESIRLAAVLFCQRDKFYIYYFPIGPVLYKQRENAVDIVCYTRIWLRWDVWSLPYPDDRMVWSRYVSP